MTPESQDDGGGSAIYGDRLLQPKGAPTQETERDDDAA